MEALDHLAVMALIWERNRARRTRVGQLIEAAKDNGDAAALAVLAQEAAAWAGDALALKQPWSCRCRRAPIAQPVGPSGRGGDCCRIRDLARRRPRAAGEHTAVRDLEPAQRPQPQPQPTIAP